MDSDLKDLRITGQRKLYWYFFHFSSWLTAHFPAAGARILNSFAAFLVNPFFMGISRRSDDAALKKVKIFNKILVIGDLNIGDAVNIQPALAALREVFPDAQLDYVISRFAYNLVKGSPDISNVLPAFSGNPYPTDEDHSNLKEIIVTGNYDVIFNFCPFFRRRKYFGRRLPVVNFSTFASILVKNELAKAGIRHVSFQIYRYVLGLVSQGRGLKPPRPFPGTRITLSESAVEKAKIFLASYPADRSLPLVMLNPDASSRFTEIPFGALTRLLKKIADMPCRLILGRGITFTGIKERLLKELPPQKRRKIIVPPPMTIEEYAALLDSTDIYITGDTGPMHIAAARKYSENGQKELRNRTSVFSIFGATPSHIYGYDSYSASYLSANQDAPSHVYAALSQCRNITCINKMSKTCPKVKCFGSVDTAAIAGDVLARIENIKR